MSEALATQGFSEPVSPALDRDELRARLRGTNINEETFLATDYLNHFNEIIMMIELVPSMPECLDEVRAWQPKSYEAHFQDSCFADKELAVLAYRNAPARFKEPFDKTIAHMDRLAGDGLASLSAAVEAGDAGRIELEAITLVRGLQRLVEVASGIIHGDERTFDQAAIDQILCTCAPARVS